jgi:hypothetical protein
VGVGVECVCAAVREQRVTGSFGTVSRYISDKIRMPMCAVRVCVCVCVCVFVGKQLAKAACYSSQIGLKITGCVNQYMIHHMLCEERWSEVVCNK